MRKALTGLFIILLIVLAAWFAPIAAQQVINGYRIFVAVAAPSTPAAGTAAVYVDSTSKKLCNKDDAGVVSCTGQSADVAGLITTFCTGAVGTGNGTTYILTPGPTTTAVCTNTAVVENPIAITGTAKNMYASVGTACTTGTSGAKLYKNGTVTALIVTGLSDTAVHSDTSDTVSFTAGDTWSVRFLANQATETCANARVQFQITNP